MMNEFLMLSHITHMSDTFLDVFLGSLTIMLCTSVVAFVIVIFKMIR